MRIRKVGVAALASAFALGGMVVGSVGVAGAKKAVLDGTITCHIGATVNITPSLVNTIPNKKEATATKPAKPGKDKGPKLVNDNGVLSQCTGTPVSGGAPIPTGGTTTSKSKGTSRLCSAFGGSSTTKGKSTFSDGNKLKTEATASDGGSFDPVTQTTHVFTPGDTAGTGAWLVAHPDDRLTFTLTAPSGGKAFPGNTVTTKVVTTEKAFTLFAVTCASQAGVTAIHLDPTFSRFTAS